MVAIELRFIAGKYHATPWGRHVNEADVEWPPSPWRIFRAFLFTFHRKLCHEGYDLSTLAHLLDKLAHVHPEYLLPPGVHTHVRHYMPIKKTNKKIFDGFLRVSPQTPLMVWWPGISLDEEETMLLDALLPRMGYLGRAETWVDARRISGVDQPPNSYPENTRPDPDGASRLVPLLCPIPSQDYEKIRTTHLETMKSSGLKGKAKTQFAHSLPKSWIDAVAIETDFLQKAGWNLPPAARRVFYRIPADIVVPQSKMPAIAATRTSGPKVSTVRFALVGKPLPRVEDALRIGEATRWALIRCVETYLGFVPALISGHGLDPQNRHGHAFFIPEPGPKGTIDHILVHVADGIDPSLLEALKQFQRLWVSPNLEWNVFFEGAGDSIDFHQISQLTGTSRKWITLTPYLHPWYRKKTFRIEDQIRRECRLRDLPDPEHITLFRETALWGRPRRPVHFRRFRNKRGLRQPDTLGTFVELTFPTPVKGPLALGFGCHFGLGMFACTS